MMIIHPPLLLVQARRKFSILSNKKAKAKIMSLYIYVIQNICLAHGFNSIFFLLVRDCFC